MTRWLVTGATGMLGREVVAALAGRDVVAAGRDDLDVTDAAAVASAVAAADVVVNTAAWTAVDAAEEHEAEALRVNADGPELLARAAARHGARLIHVSTDYVFDGAARAPYAESDPVSPLNAYGRTKAAGERRALAAAPDLTTVVRTAWLYGGPGDFPSTMLARAAAGAPLAGAVDQVGQPTWARELAAALVTLGERGSTSGILHATNTGRASRWEWLRAVLDLGGFADVEVAEVPASHFPLPAPRPAFSVLGHERWAASGLPVLRPWRAALAEALA